MAISEGAVAAAFVLIADLAMAKGCPLPISKHPGAYEMQVDENWFVAINGRKEPIAWKGAELPAFSAALEFNGWHAGIIFAGGGTMAAGELANEDTLIAALEKAIEAEKSRANH